MTWKQKQTTSVDGSFAKKLPQNERQMNSLVGGFNPEENISQIGSFPQVGVKIKIFETT